MYPSTQDFLNLQAKLYCPLNLGEMEGKEGMPGEHPEQMSHSYGLEVEGSSFGVVRSTSSHCCWQYD